MPLLIGFLALIVLFLFVRRRPGQRDAVGGDGGFYPMSDGGSSDGGGDCSPGDAGGGDCGGGDGGGGGGGD